MIFDLIAMQSAAQGAGWTPADLFKNGEEGFWFDSSDFSTMFQDSSGTTPVTAAGQRVGLWKNKITGQLANWNVSQGTTAFSPLLVDTSGKFALRFDGVDDKLKYVTTASLQNNVTNTSLAFGQKKSVNNTSVVMELSSGSTNLYVENQSDGSVLFNALGVVIRPSALISNSSPNVIVGVTRGSTSCLFRINGVQTTGGNATDVVRTIRTVIPSIDNACDISQAVFIDRALTSEEITLLEAFIASKQ